MGDVRDPERDQPLPKPGGLPVQAILIAAIQERTDYGRAKYGDVLRTKNGRNALKDAWEELMDFTAYFTQYVLEEGVELPGMREALEAEPQHERDADAHFSQARVAEILSIPHQCEICGHEPHIPGGCRSDAQHGRTSCQCGVELISTVKAMELCPHCSHGLHASSRCGVDGVFGHCSCPAAA